MARARNVRVVGITIPINLYEYLELIRTTQGVRYRSEFYELLLRAGMKALDMGEPVEIKKEGDKDGLDCSVCSDRAVDVATVGKIDSV